MSSYDKDDRITIGNGKWVVRDVYNRDGVRVVVGLVDPANPHHGTAFSSDVLDQMIVDGHARREPAVTAQAKVFAPARPRGMEHAVRAGNGTVQIYSWTGLGIPGDTIPIDWVELSPQVESSKTAALQKLAAGYSRRSAEIRAAVEGYDTGTYQDKLQAFDAIRAIVEGGQR